MLRRGMLGFHPGAEPPTSHDAIICETFQPAIRPRGWSLRCWELGLKERKGQFSVRFTPAFGEAAEGIRRMRGSTQAHLVKLADGSSCVVKFANNPAGARVLVNELVASLLLGELSIATPSPAVIHVGEDFLQRNPEVSLTLGGVPYRPTAGWHFGSRFPGDPSTTAVYDFLPDSMLPRVANRDDFLGVHLFDLWTCNAPRQAIFFREKVNDSAATIKPSSRWVAQMIDHARAFGGAGWRFSQTKTPALYRQRAEHGRKLLVRDYAPWIARVMALPGQVFGEILQRVPADWVLGGEGEAREMIAQLGIRRGCIPALLAEALASRTSSPALPEPAQCCR
jgi:hypothetical protein